jgi:glucose/mannose-6-phosphate isomerase
LLQVTDSIFSANAYIPMREFSWFIMKKGVLDDPRVTALVDPSGMLRAVDSSPELLLNPLSMRNEQRITLDREIEQIVFGAMGGSAIAADVIVDWLIDRLKIASFVVRDARLPRFVNKTTLVVALSYSGETTETLSLYKSAHLRGCPILAISTGGRLIDSCERDGSPFLNIRPSVSPRAALYQMVSACSIALEEIGLGSRLLASISETGKELSRLRRLYTSTNETSVNKAKKFAHALKGRFPAVYGLQRMACVARRFKNQLNENSKLAAKFDLLPESGHNEVEAWHETGNLIPVLIRDGEESAFESRVLDGFKHTISKAASTKVSEVKVESKSTLGRLLCPIFFLDYVSVYLAFLRGVDPTPTILIKEFRRNIG